MWYKSEPSDSPFFSQYPPIFDISVRKNDPHIRVLAGFLDLYWLNYTAKTASIPGPLAGFGRGAFLPYFGKQGDI
jgi:hypothetical protein